MRLAPALAWAALLFFALEIAFLLRGRRLGRRAATTLAVLLVVAAAWVMPVAAVAEDKAEGQALEAARLPYRADGKIHVTVLSTLPPTADRHRAMVQARV